MIELSIKTSHREELVDITTRLAKIVADEPVGDGYLFCYVPHTTAAITINESADPDVSRDFISKLSRLIPQQDNYHHAEGNSDAHIKSSLTGCTIQVPFEGNRLLLGRWQGVFFCEYDGPRSRRLMIRVSRFG